MPCTILICKQAWYGFNGLVIDMEAIVLKKIHFQGIDPVAPFPGTRGWDRVIARGCGGDTYHGYEYSEFYCRHEYGWTCDDCPIVIKSEEEKHQQWLKDMATVQGPPRRYLPEKWQTEIWEVWPEVETELGWLKEAV